MKKNLTTRFKTKMSVIFTAMLMLAVSFSCTSIEEQPTLDENAMFKKAFLEELEKIHSSSHSNARNGNALPSVQVTLAVLRATDNWVPAVKDRATVFMATDEAYAIAGITTKNLDEANIMRAMAAIANQVIPAEKFSGNRLSGINGTLPNLLSLIPIFNPENPNVPINVETTLIVTKGEKGEYILNDSFGQTANIIRTDFKATNSVTHFIDKVLFPFPESSEE